MPVVYDGVEGSGEGDLFKGLKLWISHRVPQRSRWVGLVKGNGGEVVPLEKQADMLIADNLKRGGAAPPSGSYTWQWIDYSVKNGFLQPREDYLITAASEPRAVGSSAPAKKTRTPFTNHDDLILTKFVVAQERAGNSTQGTEIFKELETKQPRHTWQSWRERWVKNLAYRNKPDLSHSGSDPDTEVEGSPEPPVPASRLPEFDGSAEQGRPTRSAQEPMSTPKAKQAQPPTAEAEAEAPAPARRPKGRGRNFFTKEEDALLLQYIREAQEYNRTAYGYKVRSLSGNKIYQEFAYEHPNHTWHAWRDRWLRHLSRVDDDEVNDAIIPEQEGEAAVRVDGEQRPQPQPQVNSHTVEPASLAAARKTNTPGVHTEATGAKRAALPNPENPSTLKRPQAMTDDKRLERREQAKTKVRAANVYVGKIDVARFETLVVPLQSLVRGYLVRKREAEALLRTSDERDQLLQAGADGEGEDHYEDAEEELESHDLGPEGSETTTIRSARDQFYDDLKLYIHSGAEVDLEPVVEGRKIDLWDLFEAATRQACSPEERNWKEVAEGLGFDWVKSARCLPRLWECYLQNLTEFEKAMKLYDDAAGEGEDGDEDGSEDEVGQEEQEHQISAAREEEESLPEILDATIAPRESLAAPSSHIYQSSPPIAGIKRSFRHADGLSSERSYPSESSRKRRRTDQSEEIPPTPEDRLGLTTDLAAGHNTALVDLSPPNHRQGSTAQFLGDEEADELPEHRRAPDMKLAAPERRNSGFVIGGDAHVRKAVERGDYVYVSDEDEDEDDISPSQQLHNESDAIDDPVPPSSRRHHAASSTNRRLFAAPTSRLAANTVSSPALNAVKAKGAAAGPNGLVNGKTTRRSLPQTYQKPSASAPPVRASGIPPTRAVQPATSRGKYATPSTPTPARPSSSTIRLPSSSRRLPPTSSAPPPLPTSGARSPGFDNDPAVIDAQFAHFQALGYEKAHIGRAMEAATFQRGPMTVALQSLHEGRGLPAREAGVWTDSDDERLKAVRDYDRRVRKGKFTAEEEEEAEDDDEEKRLGVRNERFRAKLMAKHGRWVEHRLQFMDMMDQGA